MYQPFQILILKYQSKPSSQKENERSDCEDNTK